MASKYKEQNEELRISHLHELELLREKTELDSLLIQEIKEKNEIKESINKELEQKVIERNKDLYAKNDELGEAYKQLSFYKDKLENEWVKIDKEKWELSKQINESIFDGIKGKEVDYQTFSKIFPSSDSCLKYVSELKWANGFVCKQCGNNKYIKGNQSYSRKCTKCANRETVTANTLFHGIRFDISKAMYITYITHLGKQKHSNKQLAELLNLRLGTCSKFQKKVEETKVKLNPRDSWENLILNS